MFSNLKGEVGVTLVSVMLILLLMMVLGAGLLTSALMENKIVHNLEDSKQAFYLAQAGIEYASYKLQQDLTWRIDSYTKILGNGQFILTVSNTGENELQIHSVGIADQNQKTLEVGVHYTIGVGSGGSSGGSGSSGGIIDEMAQYSAIGGGDIYVRNNAYFEDGDLRSNGDITFYNNSYVDGDVIASGSVSGSGNENFLGEVSEEEDVYGIPGVDWDKLLEDALTDGVYLTSWNSSKLKDYKVNYIANSFSLTQKENVILEGILVVRGNFSVRNKAILTSLEGLMIFVDGSVELKSNGRVEAAIFATGPISIGENTEVEGAIYSAERIECTNNASVTLNSDHLYQSNVEEYLINSDDEESTMTFTYWREI